MVFYRPGGYIKVWSSGGGGGRAAAAVRLLQLRMSGGKKYKKEPAAGPVDITAAPEFKYGKTENVLNPVIKEESWRFQPESVTEYRQRKAEEDRQEELHAQENGTALLTQDEDKNRFRYLKALTGKKKILRLLMFRLLSVSIRNWQISASGILRSAVFICGSIREGYILLLI